MFPCGRVEFHCAGICFSLWDSRVRSLYSHIPVIFPCLSIVSQNQSISLNHLSVASPLKPFPVSVYLATNGQSIPLSWVHSLIQVSISPCPFFLSASEVSLDFFYIFFVSFHRFLGNSTSCFPITLISQSLYVCPSPLWSPQKLKNKI